MEHINLQPAELLATLDPTPEDPEPILINRDAWLQLMHAAHAETRDHVWIWTSEGVYRISKVWIGHPAIADHWQLIIKFGGDNV